MSEQNEQIQASVVSDRIAKACLAARCETAANQSDEGTAIRAAYKDLNSKGNGPCWYRMVWRGGSWQYFSDERLPSGTFLAKDRCASVSGEVFAGDIVCSHDKGGPVNRMWLICEPDAEGLVMVPVEFKKRRDGNMAVALPDGEDFIVPNPRQ